MKTAIEYLNEKSQEEIESALDDACDVLATAYRFLEAGGSPPDVLAEIVRVGQTYESALSIVRQIGKEGAAAALQSKKRELN